MSMEFEKAWKTAVAMGGEESIFRECITTSGLELKAPCVEM